MQFVVRKELYVPSEAEEITGLSQQAQRDHRRREYLPKTDGHARFDAFDLLKLAAVHEASKFNIGPSKAYDAADWIAHSSLGHLLTFPGGVDVDLELLWEKNYWPGVNQTGDFDEDSMRKYVGRRLLKSEFGRPNLLPNNIAVFWSDGGDFSGQSVEQAVEWKKNRGEPSGSPMLVFPLAEFAKEIQRRLPRPAATIVLNPEKQKALE